MVGTMADAYEMLPGDEQQRVILLAVGIENSMDSNANFCQGQVQTCPNDNWWYAWDANQRDVFFYIKNHTNGGLWELYCQYSMNSNRDEFGDTLLEMLDITASSLIEPAPEITGTSGTLNITADSPKSNETNIFGYRILGNLY